MEDPFTQWRSRRKRLEAKARRILGVGEEESFAGLKRAYRRQAKATHPDVNPGDIEAGRKFMRIKSAYRVLAKGADEPLEGEIEDGGDPLEILDEGEYMQWWIRKWG